MLFLAPYFCLYYSSLSSPFLVITISDVFNEAQPGSKILKQVKEDIWNYEIIKVLILVLKQNFDNIEGQWRTAAELATFARLSRSFNTV